MANDDYSLVGRDASCRISVNARFEFGGFASFAGLYWGGAAGRCGKRQKRQNERTVLELLINTKDPYYLAVISRSKMFRLLETH